MAKYKDVEDLMHKYYERYRAYRVKSETRLPNGDVEIDDEMQCAAIVAKTCFDELEKLPTVDAVKVVRCVNCEKWSPFEKYRGYCYRYHENTNSEDFCSCGEEKAEVEYG